MQSTTAETPRQKRTLVRATVDLEPALHRQLRLWCINHDMTIADVYRMLTVMLLERPELARDVQTRLQMQAPGSG